MGFCNIKCYKCKGNNFRAKKRRDLSILKIICISWDIEWFFDYQGEY